MGSHRVGLLKRFSSNCSSSSSIQLVREKPSFQREPAKSMLFAVCNTSTSKQPGVGLSFTLFASCISPQGTFCSLFHLKWKGGGRDDQVMVVLFCFVGWLNLAKAVSNKGISFLIFLKLFGRSGLFGYVWQCTIPWRKWEQKTVVWPFSSPIKWRRLGDLVKADTHQWIQYFLPLKALYPPRFRCHYWFKKNLTVFVSLYCLSGDSVEVVCVKRGT